MPVNLDPDPILKNIIQSIQQVASLPLAEEQFLLAQMERIEVHKNTVVISADQVEKYVYFIEKGIARAYCHTEKGQQTIWFGEEGTIMVSFMSSFKNAPGYEYIEMLEDSILYRVSNTNLNTIYANNILLANWGRKFAEQELLQTEERFISYLFKTATERYEELLQRHPSLIKRVQLGYIASYLGITQVSLSRIRAGIR